uniref:Uncharacterized protein n=1 Tax=Anguilla anguilla TaxID=7936 RepID=A0A0E9TBX7_ANGAN
MSPQTLTPVKWLFACFSLTSMKPHPGLTTALSSWSKSLYWEGMQFHSLL